MKKILLLIIGVALAINIYSQIDAAKLKEASKEAVNKVNEKLSNKIEEIMYVKLQGHITINRQDGRKLSFNAFNAVEIEKDRFKINSSCKIKIPISCRLEYKGTDRAESVQTAKLFA